MTVMAQDQPLAFSLNAALRVQSIRQLDGETHPLQFHLSSPSAPGAEAVQTITVELKRSGAVRRPITLVWEYEGPIDDPPREPRHLRFVTPSETSGHIGPEGVYVSGETHWYPEVPRSL